VGASPRAESFTPSFRHFQKDIERFLKSEGQVGKNEHGQTVYRGYQAALAQMFRAYLGKEAYAPLVEFVEMAGRVERGLKA
jgi:hypothetical protein